MSSRDLWSLDDGAPVLHGVRCLACGATMFPPQRYGCEACGAFGDRLVDTTIPTEGRLHSYTTVYLHPKLPTPFLVGEIATSAGPLVRTRLAVDSPVLGMPVVGHVVDDGERQQIEFGAREVG
ncbi:MAG: hypothetical protein QM733_07180 [Ilumatobacteraceae bacterium]